MIINQNQLEGRDLLVVCPSRGRPNELWRMYESFNKTISAKTALIICLDNDDNTIYNDFSCTLSIEPRKSITRIYNDIYKKYPDFKYYSCTNDDFVYKTIGWDYQLMETGGISFGHDLNHDSFPTTSVIDGDIVRALDWLQMPELNHLYGDTVWNQIGQESATLHFHPEVIIEHCHYLFGKAERPTYEKVIDPIFIQQDRLAYIRWLATQSHYDIEKVKNVKYNRLSSSS